MQKRKRSWSLLAVVLAGALAGCAAAPHGATPPRDVANRDYGPAADFTLPDVAGGRFRLSEQAAAHRVVVLTFVTADCTEECPKVDAVLRSAAVRFAHAGELGRKVEIASVELDPATNGIDTERKLRAELWPHRGWSFLRGSVAETRPVIRAYDVTVEPRAPGKDLVHSSLVYVIDDRLRQVDLLSPGMNLTPAAVVSAVHDAARRG